MLGFSTLSSIPLSSFPNSTFPISISLNGSGSVSPVADTFSGSSALLSGLGQLLLVPSLTMDPSLSLVSTGSFFSSFSSLQAFEASLQAAGSVGAAGSLTLSPTMTFTGSSSMGIFPMTYMAVASLVGGQGSISASFIGVIFVGASLSASSSLSGKLDMVYYLSSVSGDSRRITQLGDVRITQDGNTRVTAEPINRGVGSLTVNYTTSTFAKGIYAYKNGSFKLADVLVRRNSRWVRPSGVYVYNNNMWKRVL